MRLSVVTFSLHSAYISQLLDPSLQGLISSKNDEPIELLQIGKTIMKSVIINAIVFRVHVIGVARMDFVAGWDIMEMDVMALLVGKVAMSVY